MKLCLAIDDSDWKEYKSEILKSKYILASFYYIQKSIKEIKQANFDLFLLDSGAFTFMFSKKHVKLKELEIYLDKYIEFINKYDIKYFFELDVDSLFGYEQVLKFREKLERETGKKCIPVWHKSRGKDEFIKMCKEHDYGAIGGIVTKEIKKDNDLFSALNKLANSYGCKLHGLGYTNSNNLHKSLLYSVDSTTWKTGKRFASIYQFKNDKLTQVKKGKGKGRLKDFRKLDIHNLRQWIMYQQYLERF